MAEKIIKHPGHPKNSPKENIISKLRLKFPRLERNLDNAESIPNEEKNLYPIPIGSELMRLSRTLADEGYIKWDETSVDDFIGNCLDHVLYRSLKSVYGLPDPIAFDVLEWKVSDNGSKVCNSRPIEWGYLIQSNVGSIIEILKRYRDSSTKVFMWLNSDKRPEKIPNEFKNGITEFMKTFSNLVKIVDQEYSIQQEQKQLQEITKGKKITGLINLYYQNFQAGKDILVLSDALQPGLEESHNELFSKGEFDESLSVFRKMNLLYITAILHFIIALEGFVNLIYELLLKQQFKHQDYSHHIWKSNLQLRILNIPVYCEGFTKADITPESKAYKLWLSIRNFRNNLVHANITEEIESIATIEDSFVFQYNPLNHIRLKDKIKFHTHPLYISRDDSINVMNTVELIVSELIEQMDEEIKTWTKSWINGLVIMKNKMEFT